MWVGGGDFFVVIFSVTWRDLRFGGALKTCKGEVALLHLRKPPPATEPFRALRARNPKVVKNESKKSLPGPPVPGVPKSPKRVQKESEKRKWTLFDSFLTLFGLFLDFLGPWDRRARETPFFDSFFDLFWGFRARRVRKRLCSWWALSQSYT